MEKLIIEQDLTKHRLYSVFKRQIDAEGCIAVNLTDTGQRVQVYTPELALILLCDVVSDNELLKTYITGFFEGERFFQLEYKLTIDTLYSSDKISQYIEALKQPYFSEWIFVKKQYPLIVTEKVIQKYGYYSGVISACDAMTTRHKIIFEKHVNHAPAIPTDLLQKIWQEFENDLGFEDENEFFESMQSLKHWRGESITAFAYLFDQCFKVLGTKDKTNIMQAIFKMNNKERSESKNPIYDRIDAFIESFQKR